MKRRKRQKGGIFRFRKLQTVIVVFLLLVGVLCFVQWNVPYEEQERELEPVEQDSLDLVTLDQDPECLIIWEDDDMGRQGLELMEDILSQMKIPYETVQGEESNRHDLEDYETVVLSVTHWNILDETLLKLRDWLEGGGSLMALYPPDINGSFQVFAKDFGIERLGNGYVVMSGLRMTRPFMIGGDKEYVITDPFESSLSVSLDDSAEVYMESTDENPVPLLWKTKQGEGEAVFCNIGIVEKAYRGFYSTAYSLLEETCAWPVINGSTFYIDDFPSPVPGGESKYIKRDYGMTVSEFYTQVWWNDVYNLAEEYGIRYTGLVIEQYSDDVEQPYERNNDIQRYRYFGNMLLDQGGEIGFHGYNHMPLCLLGFDYGDGYESYRLWHSYEDMLASIQELKTFCEELFPKEKFQVYVPPSNILSEEGRTMLKEDVEGIKAIASVYIGDTEENAYEQEFEVAEDGMIETPRIISGYIMADYTQLIAFSELNFHYVNTHFQHPDDTLDEDRGAALGWEEMYQRISDYTEWLYTSAPDIRNLTGSELAAAVQIYDNLEVERDYTDGRLKLHLANFRDEAWLMVRINEGMPGEVTGGSLTEVAEGLYLLEAQDDEIEIVIGQ